jgi:hypothetical protein
MSNQYAGGFISKTPPTVTPSSAQGMWTLSHQAQYQKAGVWPNALVPSVIGQAWGGGFYAGQISTTGNGVATHYLIVAPRTTGQSGAKRWGIDGVTTNINSLIDGPTNSAALASLGANYEAAIFCEGLTIGGYTDWYLPAKNELEILFYFFRSYTTAIDTSSGANVNAVSPEPINTNYTSTIPAITTATQFQSGMPEQFLRGAPFFYYWSSSSDGGAFAWQQNFDTGQQQADWPYSASGYYARAVRRIPI